METLGERIRELREKRGFSIAEASRKISVSPSTFRDWEYGREIKGEPYVKIANYFGVSLNYLLTGQKLDVENSLQEIEKHIKTIRSSL